MAQVSNSFRSVSGLRGEFILLRYNPPVPRRRDDHARRASLVGSAGGGRDRRHVLGAFTLRRALTPAAFWSSKRFLRSLPADGFSSTELKIRSSTGRDLRGLRVEVDDSHRAAVESVTVNGDSAR